MAIMITVVMPVWKQAAQREKEEELVFRGKQYVHAIGLFQRKFANAYPPNIDVLVEQRFLRKKFKDPITNDDFVPIPVGQGAPGDVSSRAASAARPARPAARRTDADVSRRRQRRQPGRAGGRGAGRRSAPGQAAQRRHQWRDQQEQGLNRFASTTDAATTTSGPSSTFSSSRLPAPAAPPVRRRRDAAASADSPASRPVRSQAAISLVSADAVPSVPTDPDAATAASATFGGGGVTPIQPPPTPRGRF